MTDYFSNEGLGMSQGEMVGSESFPKHQRLNYNLANLFPITVPSTVLFLWLKSPVCCLSKLTGLGPTCLQPLVGFNQM